MRIADLQAQIGAAADGIWGPQSKAALLAWASNLRARGIEPSDIAAAAARIGCSILQLEAVRAVEAAGRGFDRAGRPKILFERHKFHRFTGGRFSPTDFSQSRGGGYTNDANRNGINDSWDKLSDAIATGQVNAAFMSASWGAFQIMGEWWDEMGYVSPFAMVAAATISEAHHLDMLVRFIRFHRLEDEVRAITSNPETNRAFAAAYNGPGYRRNNYHIKLADWMRQ
jgi:hypothetical protein